MSLYWKNPDPRKYVNVVPTSAITGEGIPDLLQLVVKLTQSMMAERLMFVDDTQCTGEGVVWASGAGSMALAEWVRAGMARAAGSKRSVYRSGMHTDAAADR